MKARMLLILLLLGVSNLGFGQAQDVEEISFWNQRFMGLQVFEIVIAVVAVFAVVFVAYKLSVSKK